MTTTRHQPDERAMNANSQTAHRKPRGMHYTPHQAVMNNFAAIICGIKPAAWLAADLAANVDKAEKAQAHELTMELKAQAKFDREQV